MRDRSYLERLTLRFLCILREYRFSVFASLAAGLASYMFCFTNKLEIMDDLACMFGQGASLSSGRWGLDLAAFFMPTFSVPWLNGILSLLLLSAAACIVVKMFEIRSTLLKILLPAVMITFPSQTCTFAYMFTAPQYALALLLAVISADMLASQKKVFSIGKFVSACILLIFSLSIYQPYVAVAASYLVVYVIYLLLKGEKENREILRRGGVYVAALAGSMIVYYLLTAVIKRICSTEFNSYADGNLNGISEILFGVRVAYTSFIAYFYKGYYDLISSPVSKAAHILAVAVTVPCIYASLLKKENRPEKSGRMILLTVCFILLPLSVNCIRVISSLFHNLMLFSFTSVYILAAVAAENCADLFSEKKELLRRDIVYGCMILVTACNIYFSNCVYYKMYLQLDQAESFYTAVISSLMNDEDFHEDSRVAFVGKNDVLYDVPMIQTENLTGIREGILGTYSQKEFIKVFLGVDLNVCGWDVTDNLEADPRVLAMPSYPYYGSIRQIDGIYVVRLGS